MIEHSLVADLVKHRSDIFGVIPRYAEVLNESWLFEHLSHTVEELVNAPSFDTTNMTFSPFQYERLLSGERFTMPFDVFSAVASTDKTDVLLVMERVPPRDIGLDVADVLIISQFYKSHKGWRPQPPVVVFNDPNDSEMGIAMATGRTDINDAELGRRFAEQFRFVRSGEVGTDQVISEYCNGVAEIALGVLGRIMLDGGEAKFRPASATRQTAAKAAKLPKAFWEYHLVDLSAVRQLPSAPKGGTHATPRFHMVRGHWRHLRSGKEVFIPAHGRGDKTKGIIEKDYAYG